MSLKIEAGKYYRTRDGRKVGPMERDEVDGKDWREKDNGAHLWYDDGSSWSDDCERDLIAEWQDQPARTVTTNGRHYDLTKLETPFGLLPKPVQEALRAWPHGWEYYGTVMNPHGWANVGNPIWNNVTTYRAKPAPAETRVKCIRASFADSDLVHLYETQEYGTCIKRDGEILWDTWEPEA